MGSSLHPALLLGHPILGLPAPSPLLHLKRGSCPRCLAWEVWNSLSARLEHGHRQLSTDAVPVSRKETVRARQTSNSRSASSLSSSHRLPQSSVIAMVGLAWLWEEGLSEARRARDPKPLTSIQRGGCHTYLILIYHGEPNLRMESGKHPLTLPRPPP